MRDTWMNQCLACGTNNPSPAFKRPDTCSGCGSELECVRQYPWEADGLFGELRRVTDNEKRKVRRQERKKRLKKWNAQAIEMGIPLSDDDDD